MARSNKLFKDLEIRNKVSRNGFDLSDKCYFTAKVGELLPIYHRTCMPGDVFRFRVNSFTRTRPVETAAFTKIYEYFDFFFVPYRLLGKQIPHILSQDLSNPVVALSPTSNSSVGTYLPRITLNNLRGEPSGSVPKHLSNRKNEFGFYRAILSGKLLNHLGYFWQSTKGLKHFAGIDDSSGDDNSSIVYYSVYPFVSLLPLAAYQKIYYDFFRNSQWQGNQPYNYNFDYMSNTTIFDVPTSEEYWNNPTLFDLHYSNYPKDLFFGLLPDSQFGDTSVVEISGLTDPQDALISADVIDSDDTVVSVGNKVGNNVNINEYSITNTANNTPLTGQLGIRANLELLGTSLKGQFDILEFRKARFVQHYREIVGTGKRNMKSLISRIYGYEIPDTLTDECYYLGGHSNVISISEVDNTNLADNNQVVQKGKGTSSSDGDLVEFEAKEYGVVMCIYHAIPEIDFALNNCHFDVLKANVDDYANPVFDNLGLQEFNSLFIDNTSTNAVQNTLFVGYTSRYYDYKTSIDRVFGDFRETLSSWVAPLTSEYLFQYDGLTGNRPGLLLDYRFFKVNPSILNSIFDVAANSYLNTDQLRVAATFSVNAVRGLSYLGIPND